MIRHVSENIKELQKDKKFDEIRTIIFKIKQIIGKNLQKNQ